jgi:ATP-dependent DNA helicase PIF1
MEKMQKETCDAVLKGHNVLILGQGGTGKSFLLSIIKKELTKLGKSVSITSSTGVASLNVEGITIHAWSGIGDGHFSNEQLVTKILTDEHYLKYRNNIFKADVLIIDEISMLSCKLFDQLEYICIKVRTNNLYFGGLQVVGSGDFFQLPPVPDPLKYDPGEFCFKSKLFSSPFRHKFILEKVIRQDEPDLIQAVNDVSKGNLPTETYNLLRRLQQPLPPGDDPTRLFATNFEKEVYNASRLIDLEGVIKMYDAIDEGDMKLFGKMQVPKTLCLKKSCPVMYHGKDQ